LSSLSSSVLRRVDECSNRTSTRARNNTYFVFSLIDPFCQCYWHANILFSSPILLSKYSVVLLLLTALVPPSLSLSVRFFLPSFFFFSASY
jgi:hypothetical protein